MAEQNAKQAAGGDSSGKSGKPILLYALVVVNMLAVIGVGVLLFLGRQKDIKNAQVVDKAAQGMVEDAGGHGEAKAEGEHGESKQDKKEEEEDFVGKMIPLETFLVNPSGTRGNKLLKVNMELEVEGEAIAIEIDKRKPQIRDIIIILLSSKTYAQLSSPEGKDFLREEIRDTVNSFMTKGKVKRVLFTEFIFN